MENDLNSIKKLLENNGYEFTIQKHLILNVLLESNFHLNAKQIYDKVKDKNIGLATVYRALKIFKGT